MYFILEDPMFHAQYLYVESADKEFALKAFKDHVGDELSAQEIEKASGYCVADGKGNIAIWLREWEPGAMAHETLHATLSALMRVEIPINGSTEEVYTYYQEWLVNAIEEGRTKHGLNGSAASPVPTDTRPGGEENFS